jgi:16S rRNA (uracil1498-N3)-methyltransferase
MAIPSFYHQDLTEHDKLVQLSAAEAAHALKSRRLGVGQKIRLLNGRGLVAECAIEANEQRSVSVRISEFQHHPEAQTKLTIATAVPKGDRQRVLVDMLTQIGVSEIVPLACEHSVTRYKASMHDKWQRWAVEAIKQSQNPWLPIIDEGMDLLDLIKIAPERLVYTDAQGDAVQAVKATMPAPIVLIGPEGGFSPAEIELFHKHKIKAVRLAGSILRTETAAVALASLWLAQD